ncbi:MAG TPA: phenylalanine--tRNA ligase subunit beta [Gemmatimonadales bacterium]|nr:phenylalanine--tRNA ligase subunit beta [Gemmatimonadales bacterium]
MILSRRWLEAMLGRSLDPKDLEHRLSMLGTPVEAIIPHHQDLGDVLVARVLEVKRHPNADRLSLCLVDGGGAPVEVVCGAPNVTAGHTYPYAPVGAVLPGGLKLEKRKIRGVESNGMLCSAKELGLGADHAGIFELATDAAPGTRLLDALPLADDQIVIEVTANRPDLLCHKGVARELGASLSVPFRLVEIPGAAPVPAPERSASASGTVGGVQVRLEDTEGCPRYLAAVIRGVRVGPSPSWLALRLEAVGQRPINNVVDATNYILFEINQPLHAFDLAQLDGPAVVIRRAGVGERIVTLDGVERTLSPDMTAICDARRPTIVAGIMGSATSEVSANTRDLVLECAYFEPRRIRRTRRALGLSSESSYRFERGIDLHGMPEAMRRAIALIQAVAGGELTGPPLDLWPEPTQPRTIFLRPDRVSALLGTPVAREEIERHLSAIGFVTAPKDSRLAVQVPGWRPDVSREVDLVEEVARFMGYDTFPDELKPYRLGTVPDAPAERAKDRVRAALVGAGFYEARTFPLGPADGPDSVPVLNPMSAEEAHLRTRLLPGLIRRVEHNWAAHTRDVRLAEVGTVFRRGDPGTKGPVEWVSVAGVLTGGRRPAHWTEGAKVPDMDIWDLKYHFELAVGVSAPDATVSERGNAWEALAPDGSVVGWAGSLGADAPVWAAPLFGFEVRLEEAAPLPVSYRALPEHPAVERDLALILPAGVTASAVEQRLRRNALLEAVSVFDEYRGPAIPGDQRSVAWHLTFRDPTRTLRDGEVDEILARALKALEDELDVRRRAS